MPDIHIPYIAEEYMTGKDAVLEKLLEIIKSAPLADDDTKVFKNRENGAVSPVL